MAAGDAVQLGVQYLIDVGHTYYLGHKVQTVGVGSDADSNAHKDSRGATDSILTQDPRTTLDIEFDIVGIATAFKPPAKDSVLTLKGPDDSDAIGYRVVSASTSASSEIAKLTLSLIREDSMAAIYDA